MRYLDAMSNGVAWKRGVLLAVLLAGITTLAYREARHFDFTNYDDADYITANPKVQQGLTGESVRWGLTTTYFSYWHPLTWWSHMLDVELFGLRAGGHHMTNVALHVLATLALFLSLTQMTRAMERSAFVAGLFALHPLHVESVAWIAERKDVLSTLFWFLTMWAHAAYARRPGKGRYLVALGLFLLGLMSKPMLVTVPAVLLLLDVWPLRRLNLFPPPDGAPGWKGWLRRVDAGSSASLRRLLLEKVPFLTLAVASSAITFIGVYSTNRMLGTETVPIGLRLANVPISYVRYLAKMILPENMVVLYPMPEGWAWWEVAGATLLLVAVTAGVWAGMRKSPYLLVGWLWYLGTLVPTIGLIPVGWQSIADRYTYVPLVGIFIMVTWLVADRVPVWPQRRWVLGTASVLILAALAFGTQRQARHWQNNETLFQHAVNASTNNALAHYNLGLTFHMQQRWSDAVRHYQESIRMQPGKDKAYNNLGYIMNQLGQLDRATNILLQGLEVSPGNASLHLNLGISLKGLRQRDRAMAAFEESLRLNRDLTDARVQRAILLLEAGRAGDGMAELQEAVAREPDHAGACLQAAWVLATHPDDSMRDASRALEHATHVVTLTGGQDPASLLALAAARAAAGDFPGALEAADQSAALARDMGRGPFARKALEFKAAYEAGDLKLEDPAAVGGG